MKKRYLKKEQIRFEKEAAAIIDRYARRIKHDYDPKKTAWMMDTNCGLFKITTVEGSPYTITVFSRFEEDSRFQEAKQRYDSNPFSGKYNWHYCTTVEEALEDIESTLKRLTTFKEKKEVQT